MADKRILDLETIETLSDDDYVIVDSVANGTRKASAKSVGGSFIEIGTDEPSSSIQATMYAQLEDLSSGATPIWECKALYVIKDGEWVKFYDHELRDYINSVSDTLNLETERIDYVEEDISQLKQEISNKADKSELEKVSKEQQIDRDMIKSIVGDWYTEDKVTSFANEVNVPSNAYPYAEMQMVGGMSRKGNQLIDSIVFIGLNTTKDEIGTHSIVGTNTDTGSTYHGWYWYTTEYNIAVGETYTLSATVTSKSEKTFEIGLENTTTKRYSLSANTPQKVSVSFEKDETHRTIVMYFIGTVSTDEKFTIEDIQLEKGTTAHDFEPYTDTLIDAKVDEVVSVGKNLWHPFEGGYLSNIDGTISKGDITVLACTDYIATEGSDITIVSSAYKADVPSAYAYRLGLFGTDKKWISNILLTTNQPIKVSDYINLNELKYIRVSAPSDLYDSLQVEKGSTATVYSPYKEVTKLIPQAIIDLCPNYGIGVNSDCYNYIDFENKKYHKRVGVVDLGSLNWIYESISSGDNYYSRDISNSAKAYGNVICARFNNDNVSTSTLRNNAFVSSGRNLNITANGFNSDATAFKTAMNGVMLYYELATEEVVDLADVWVEDLDILNVEGNGTVKFSYENDDVYNVDVPSTILYQEKA